MQSTTSSSAKQHVEVIYRKAIPLEDPNSHYPGFAPGARVENGMRIERDVAVKMRDGVTIYVDVYRPEGATNVPVIIAWGQGKQPIEREVLHVHPAEKWFPGRILARGNYPTPKEKQPAYPDAPSAYTRLEGPDPVDWCKHGYAVINPDARGAYKSEGDIRLFSSGEGQDCHDLIEWAGVQSWSNGKVGISGNSWLAVVQWFAAAERPSHLAAIAPWEGWTDFYRHMISPGGIPEVGFISRICRSRVGSGNVEDVIEMIHKYPLMNEYWEDKIAQLDKINVPTSITANFKHFHALGSLEAFRVIPVREKWLRVINDFEWMDYYLPEIQDDLRRFFDRYLKGIENDWELTPPVRLSVLDPGGLDQVNRPEKEWPLARAHYEKLYLDAASGTLSTQPVKQESQARYAGETGQANFVIKFDRETELTGYLKLRLWVEAEGADDMDLFIYVQKLDRRGEFIPALVMRFPHPGAQGWLRVSHRELDPVKSTPSEPFLLHRRQQLLNPKEIVPVEIGIWPTSMVWHPGQQLRVMVTGHFQREPGWHEGFKYESRNPGHHIIHTGGRFDSHLLVPTIPV